MYLRSSQLCVNRHRTTGTKLLFFMPFTSSYPFVCCIMCGSATKIGIHSLWSAHTSDVVNAISASLLTSLSECTSCCTHFCCTVPSLPFLSFLFSACGISHFNHSELVSIAIRYNWHFSYKTFSPLLTACSYSMYECRVLSSTLHLV